MFRDGLPMLGQVPIREGTGFGGSPFGLTTPIPGGGAPPPPGFPQFSAEISVPGGEFTQMACYACPGDPPGARRSLTPIQASYMGCEARPVSECPGAPARPPVGAVSALPGAMVARGAPPGLMGPRRLGQNGGPPGGGPPGGGAPPAGGAPAPTQGVQPITVGSQDFNFDPFFPGFWPGWWPYQYPQYYPPQPQQQRLVCRRLEDASEREGRDVLECSYEAPAYQPPAYPPAYSYPAYAYPAQQFYRPLTWSWWF